MDGHKKTYLLMEFSGGPQLRPWGQLLHLIAVCVLPTVETYCAKLLYIAVNLLISPTVRVTATPTPPSALLCMYSL